MSSDDASESPSPSSSSDEGSDGYRVGGYHPVSVGERYGPNGRYVIEEKLGWGHFSTVWLALDTENDESSRLAGIRSESVVLPRRVALKVQKSAEHYTEAAWDEVELLATVARCAGQRMAKARAQLDADGYADVRGRAAAAGAHSPDGNTMLRAALAGEVYTVRLVDRFEHSGPNGKHVCMVFEVLGDNLLRLIKHYNYEGIPVHLVKQIVRQVCVSLDFLHRDCSIIHTDLKPENVLVAGLRGKALVDELGDAETLPALDAYRRALVLAREIVLEHAADAVSGGGPASGAPCGHAGLPDDETFCDDSIVRKLSEQLADVSLTGNARKRLKKKLRKRKKMLLERQDTESAQPDQPGRSPAVMSPLAPQCAPDKASAALLPPTPPPTARRQGVAGAASGIGHRGRGGSANGQKGVHIEPLPVAEFSVPRSNECSVALLVPAEAITAAFECEKLCNIVDESQGPNAHPVWCFEARFFNENHGAAAATGNRNATKFTIRGHGPDPIVSGIWRHSSSAANIAPGVVESLPLWRRRWRARRCQHSENGTASAVASTLVAGKETPVATARRRWRGHYPSLAKMDVGARPAVWSMRFDCRYAHDILAATGQLLGKWLPGFSWVHLPVRLNGGRACGSSGVPGGVEMMCELASWHFRAPCRRNDGAVFGLALPNVPTLKRALGIGASARSSMLFSPSVGDGKNMPPCDAGTASVDDGDVKHGIYDAWDVVGDGSSVAHALDRIKANAKIKSTRSPTCAQAAPGGIALNPLTGVVFAPQENIVVKVVDLGNGCWTHKHFAEDIQTRQYRAPEVILRAGYDTSADIWSLACVVFELVTGDILFDPRAGDDYERDEDHLALFMELLGKLPTKLTRRAKYSSRFFDRKGSLKHIRKLRYWALRDVLAEKYQLPPEEASALTSFLTPMLSFDVSQRATAADCLRHPWLASQV